MEKFMVGVNYWASHAGTDMWKNWDEETVRADLAALKENGVNVLRVFPNWRDFQPVMELWGGGHNFRQYRMADESMPTNPYFLDETMLDRFNLFCDIARENDMKLIVGLITGWMSGRLFTAPALQNKNLFTSPDAMWLEQLFIKGFVAATKHQPSIYAWDLGNECNCMDGASSRPETANWTALIVNAIRAADPTRPVVSGMHGMEPDAPWTIQDQGFWTDYMTTHPYPYWVAHGMVGTMDSFRTLLHATAQTEFYAGVGKKPCIVEEIGDMGPMVCSEEIAADFLKVNLWSNWANGSPGLLWWCGHDQGHLEATPYDWTMVERELGLLRAGRKPKPVAHVMRQFGETQKQLNLDLPLKKTQATCILTRSQDQWGVAYASYLLAKQAGMTLEFTWHEQDLPDSQVYMLPSVIGGDSMSKRFYVQLKEKVREGATLYISLDNSAILSEFQELTGFKVNRWSRTPYSATVELGGETLSFTQPNNRELIPTGAEVLIRDNNGVPFFGKHSYGKGTVYLLNMPVETMLIPMADGFEQPWYKIYSEIASINPTPITKQAPNVGLTYHEDGDKCYAVLVNYSGEACDPGVNFREDVKEPVALLGDYSQLEPFGVAVIAAKRA